MRFAIMLLMLGLGLTGHPASAAEPVAPQIAEFELLAHGDEFAVFHSKDAWLGKALTYQERSNADSLEHFSQTGDVILYLHRPSCRLVPLVSSGVLVSTFNLHNRGGSESEIVSKRLLGFLQTPKHFVAVVLITTASSIPDELSGRNSRFHLLLFDKRTGSLADSRSIPSSEFDEAFRRAKTTSESGVLGPVPNGFSALGKTYGVDENGKLHIEQQPTSVVSEGNPDQDEELELLAYGKGYAIHLGYGVLRQSKEEHEPGYGLLEQGFFLLHTDLSRMRVKCLIATRDRTPESVKIPESYDSIRGSVQHQNLLIVLAGKRREKIEYKGQLSYAEEGDFQGGLYNDFGSRDRELFPEEVRYSVLVYDVMTGALLQTVDAPSEDIIQVVSPVNLHGGYGFELNYCRSDISPGLIQARADGFQILNAQYRYVAGRVEKLP